MGVERKKYFITGRNCGLGDMLCNLAATYFFAHRYNGDVVLDWRAVPYNDLKCVENGTDKYRINLYHSIFKKPNEPIIENDKVRWFYYEEIEELTDYNNIFFHLSPSTVADTNSLSYGNIGKIYLNCSIKQIDEIVDQHDYIVVTNRIGEHSDNYKQLQYTVKETPFKEPQLELFDYIDFFKKIPIADKMREKINRYNHMFDMPNIGIHIRHGNGESRGGYTGNWYDYNEIKSKINEILNKLNANTTDYRFLICTDNKSCSLQLLSTFNDSWETTKNWLEDNAGAFHYNFNNPIKSIQEAFLDMMLLSKCKYGIFTKHSVFNVIPGFIVENCYYLDKDKIEKVHIDNKWDTTSIAYEKYNEKN